MNAWHLFNALDIITMKCPLIKESKDCVVWACYSIIHPPSLSKATQALGGSAYSANDITPSNFIKAVTQVTNYEYEDGTFWGKQVWNKNKYILNIFLGTKFCWLVLRIFGTLDGASTYLIINDLHTGANEMSERWEKQSKCEPHHKSPLRQCKGYNGEAEEEACVTNDLHTGTIEMSERWEKREKNKKGGKQEKTI